MIYRRYEYFFESERYDGKMKKALKIRTVQNIKNLGIGLAILVIIATAINIWGITKESEEISNNRTELLINSDRFISASDFLTDEIRAYVATQDISYKENYFREVEELQNREISVENMKNIGITQEEEGIILQMQALSNQLVPLETAAMETIESGQREEAIDMVFGEEYTKTKEEILSLENQFKEMLDSRTRKESSDIQEQLKLMQVVLIILLALLMVGQLITEYMMRRVVIEPICQCTDVILGISKGELKQEFKRESTTSEIGMLTHGTKTILNNMSTIINELDYSFSQIAKGNFDIDINNFEEYYTGDFHSLSESKKTIVTSLSHTLRQINSVSKQVSLDSEHVAVSATSLAEGATTQSRNIQELALSIHNITNEIGATAENSEQANIATQAVVNALEVGNERMSRMMEAMESINIKSEEVRKIIKSIDDIAFQTNLLSLNAAVEAVRAGNAGKGFVIVADEVRGLAEKSAQSAKDTADLIEETLKVVREGNVIAKETAEAIGVITDKTSEVKVYMDSISNSSNEQAQAVNNINTSIEQISHVVNQNSATSEESAAASEELSVQAQRLEAMVNKFTLKKDR